MFTSLGRIERSGKDGSMAAVVGENDAFPITSTGRPRKVTQNGTDGSIVPQVAALWLAAIRTEQHGNGGRRKDTDE